MNLPTYPKIGYHMWMAPKYMINVWSIDEQDWVKLYRTLVRGDHRVRSPIYTWEAPLCT